MTPLIAWGLAFAATAGICCGVANALTAHLLRWLRTRPRPAKPRPVRPLGPQKPYQRGAATPSWVHRDPTPTERIRRIRDHTQRLARRPM